MRRTTLLTLAGLGAASKFGADLQDGDDFACASPTANVDAKFPRLEKCFPSTSLFFSTVQSICDRECRGVAVDAAAYLVRECKLGKPNKDSPVMANKFLVYSAWADRDGVDIVCAPSTHRNTCLHDFTQASVELRSARKCRAKSTKHCTACNKSIFHKFQRDSYAIPSVYYQTVLDPEKLIKTLGSVCNWQ